MSVPGDLDVVSYAESAATFYRASTAGGRIYYVVVVGDAGFALVQADDCSRWTEVRLDDLRVEDDADDLQVAAAAIEDALVR